MSENKIELFLSPSQLNPKTGMQVTKRQGLSTSYSHIHRHDYLELEFIVSGGGWQQLNGTEYTLKTGSIFMLRPADLHLVHFTQPSLYYNISFSEHLLDKDLLRALASFHGDLITVLNPHALSTAQLLAQTLLSETQSNDPNGAILRRLLDCFMLTVQKSLPLTGAKSPELQEPLQAALTYLQMHFMENPSLQSVAQVAHYNASHFSNCFHKQMQVTYSEYLNRLKVNYAKNLLLTTDFKVIQIGTKCGFCSEANFLRVFKEQTGTTPFKFRRHARQGQGDSA